ncbi:pH-response transcription factor pacC/Rim101p [Trichomonascus vanleenenianus]|uniref:pH-response transcription factor pacC/Rim101p n=1 Tax=Trichomonascus vanleenenianus TaxID=2268995 RepID=UPI003ECA7EEC
MSYQYQDFQSRPVYLDAAPPSNNNVPSPASTHASSASLSPPMQSTAVPLPSPPGSSADEAVATKRYHAVHYTTDSKPASASQTVTPPSSDDLGPIPTIQTTAAGSTQPSNYRHDLSYPVLGTYSTSQSQQPAKQVSASPSGSSQPPLVCKWLQCDKQFYDAEELYNHLCEIHVGRKSTNNLSLVCRWENCGVSTVKRDHITSHIRVHVPLKPYKCDRCHKTFKRPQDLKKHVKTHADDTVLNGYPKHQAGVAPSMMPGMGYPILDGFQQQQQQPVAAYDYSYGYSYASNSQYQKPIPTSTGYTAAPATTAPVTTMGYDQQQQQQQQHPLAPISNDYSDSRKRAFDATLDFIDSVKRTKMAPVYTQDLASRLSSLDQTGISQYQTTPVPYAAPPSTTQPQTTSDFSSRSLPSYNSLTEAESFLNQLSSNMYQQQEQQKMDNHSSVPPQNAVPVFNPSYSGGYTPVAAPAASVNIYPTVSSGADFSSNWYNNTLPSHPHLASRYDHENARRISVGLLQRSAKEDKNSTKEEQPSKDETDELTNRLAKVRLDAEKKGEEEASDKNSLERHIKLVEDLKELVASMIAQQQKAKDQEQAKDGSKKKLYPEIAAC